MKRMKPKTFDIILRVVATLAIIFYLNSFFADNHIICFYISTALGILIMSIIIIGVINILMSKPLHQYFNSPYPCYNGRYITEQYNKRNNKK